jgi:hypothetical protein
MDLATILGIGTIGCSLAAVVLLIITMERLR